MNLKAILLDAKKAVGAAVAIEGTAVTLGLIDKPTDAIITAVLGAAVTAIVYLLDNVPKPPPSVLGPPAFPAPSKAKPGATAADLYTTKAEIQKLIETLKNPKPVHVHVHVDGKEQIATEVDPLNMHTDGPA